MNYSSNNFTEPEKFIPERWLAGDEYRGQIFDKRRQNALQPFSVGPRNCIGKKCVSAPQPNSVIVKGLVLLTTGNSLAYVEMRLILARLVWSYDLALADEASESFLDCPAFSLWLKGSLNVTLTPVVRG